jgi:putative transposase
VIERFQASQRRACELLEIAASSYRYRAKTERDEVLRNRLIVLAQEKPRYGYRRLIVLLRREGVAVNHKRVYRVYRAAGLSVKRRKRKRLVREGRPPDALRRANQQWVIDFVHDRLADGRSFRILSVVDSYTRECLALEAETSFASRRVTRVLDGVMANRERPQSIRMDNGPELTSRHFLAWGIERRVELVHIQPGKPTQNARVESFHGRMRDEFLNVSWFWNLWDARKKIASWREEYNGERPHSSLGYLTPEEFAAVESQRVEFMEEVGQEVSDADPLPHTPIPAQNGDDKFRITT